MKPMHLLLTMTVVSSQLNVPVVDEQGVNGVPWSTNSRCGNAAGGAGVCKSGCCSRFGWCGDNHEWCDCGNGCNEEWGRCTMNFLTHGYHEHACSLPDDVVTQLHSLFPSREFVEHIHKANIKTSLEKFHKTLPDCTYEQILGAAKVVKHWFPAVMDIEMFQKIVKDIRQKFPEVHISQIGSALGLIGQTWADSKLGIETVVKSISQVNEMIQEKQTFPVICGQLITFKQQIGPISFDELVNAIKRLAGAYTHLTTGSLHIFYNDMLNLFTDVSFSSLTTEFVKIHSFVVEMSLDQIGASIAKFKKQWQAPIPFGHFCSGLESVWQNFGSGADMDTVLDVFVRVRDAFQVSSFSSVASDLVMLEHGFPHSDDTVRQLADDIMNIRKHFYSPTTVKWNLEDAVHVLIVYNKHFHFEQCSQLISTLAPYMSQMATLKGDVETDADAISGLETTFANVEKLSLQPTLEHIINLATTWQTIIPDAARDLSTLSNHCFDWERMETLVTNLNRMKPKVNLPLDDITTGLHSVRVQGKYYGGFSQLVDDFMNKNLPWEDWLQSVRDEHARKETAGELPAQPVMQPSNLVYQHQYQSPSYHQEVSFFGSFIRMVILCAAVLAIIYNLPRIKKVLNSFADKRTCNHEQMHLRGHNHYEMGHI